MLRTVYVMFLDWRDNSRSIPLDVTGTSQSWERYVAGSCFWRYYGKPASQPPTIHWWKTNIYYYYYYYFKCSELKMRAGAWSTRKTLLNGAAVKSAKSLYTGKSSVIL